MGADVMESALKELEVQGVLDKLAQLQIDAQFFSAAINQFRNGVEAWKAYVEGLDLTNPLTRRTVNDQIRGFEKTFLLTPGLPDRQQYRHAIIAPSKFDAYGGSAFPGL